MVKGGLKSWVIIDGDEANFQAYLEAVQRTIPMSKFKTPSEEFQKQPCPMSYCSKKWMLTLPFLFEHNIRFRIAFQEVGDVIITRPLGAHGIFNLSPNITVARNAVTQVGIYIYLVKQIHQYLII